MKPHLNDKDIIRNKYLKAVKRQFKQGITFYFFKGESTIKEVPVQAGDNFTDYNVTVQVKIFDEQGDFSLFETTTQVSEVFK